MQLYPAIDMKGGKCVRLTQGLFTQMKVYSDTPADMAELWVSQGATFLHLVDLDGALAGHSVNEEAIRAITKRVAVPLQLGGGIRDAGTVEHLLKLGISRCIIGTKAVKQPEFIREIILEFGPERIVIGVDAKDGMVALEGWETLSSTAATELCLQMKAYGVRHIVYTDISKDGMLSGPNVSATKELADLTGLTVIASGGVSSMQDLEELHRCSIPGVIVGKALYENKIDLKRAVAQFS